MCNRLPVLNFFRGPCKRAGNRTKIPNTGANRGETVIGKGRWVPYDVFQKASLVPWTCMVCLIVSLFQ